MRYALALLIGMALSFAVNSSKPILERAFANSEPVPNVETIKVRPAEFMTVK